METDILFRMEPTYQHTALSLLGGGSDFVGGGGIGRCGTHCSLIPSGLMMKLCHCCLRCGVSGGVGFIDFAWFNLLIERLRTRK